MVKNNDNNNYDRGGGIFQRPALSDYGGCQNEELPIMLAILFGFQARCQWERGLTHLRLVSVI